MKKSKLSGPQSQTQLAKSANMAPNILFSARQSLEADIYFFFIILIQFNGVCHEKESIKMELEEGMSSSKETGRTYWRFLIFKIVRYDVYYKAVGKSMAFLHSFGGCWFTNSPLDLPTTFRYDYFNKNFNSIKNIFSEISFHIWIFPKVFMQIPLCKGNWNVNAPKIATIILPVLGYCVQGNICPVLCSPFFALIVGGRNWETDRILVSQIISL